MHKRFTKIKMLMIFLILIVSLLTFTPSVNAWGTDPHEGMAENIAITFGLNMDAYNQLKLGSTHPDHIGQNPNDHAYLVDAWPFTIGSALYWAEKFATDARTDYNYGRYSSAYYNLG